MQVPAHPPGITAITPTIGRETLWRCRKSVEAQTVRFTEHLVQIDTDRRGPCDVRNVLVERATTPWVVFIDDDDTLDPDYVTHVNPILASAPDSVAVVYTAWRVVGDVSPQPLLEFHPELIAAGRNHVPVTACVRVSAFGAVGGFSSDDELEDLGLWQRLLAAGYQFVYVPKILWTYNRSDDDSRNRRTLLEIQAQGCPTCGRRGSMERPK